MCVDLLLLLVGYQLTRVAYRQWAGLQGLVKLREASVWMYRYEAVTNCMSYYCTFNYFLLIQSDTFILIGVKAFLKREETVLSHFRNFVI